MAPGLGFVFGLVSDALWEDIDSQLEDYESLSLRPSRDTFANGSGDDQRRYGMNEYKIGDGSCHRLEMSWWRIGESNP